MSLFYCVHDISCVTTKGKKNKSSPRQSLGVHITKKLNNVSHSWWQTKNNQNDKMRVKTFKGLCKRNSKPPCLWMRGRLCYRSYCWWQQRPSPHTWCQLVSPPRKDHSETSAFVCRPRNKNQPYLGTELMAVSLSRRRSGLRCLSPPLLSVV